MNKFKKLLILSLLPLSASAADVTAWYEVTTENRPFVRWWWLGSAVDPEGLTYNLSEFARQGLGGVEITPIYGVQDNEANDIPYLSDKWMDMLAHTTAEGKRLGLQIDMNNGTGWAGGHRRRECAQAYHRKDYRAGRKACQGEADAFRREAAARGHTPEGHGRQRRAPSRYHIEGE